MKSIMQSDTNSCYLCARNGNGDRLEKHHVFGGSNRKYSEEDGLTVFLCGDRCHRNGPFSAHRNKDIASYLHRNGQIAWMQKYGSLEEFRERYGRNYIE